MDELLSDPDIAGEWEAYQDSMDTRADFFTKGDTYRLQSPVVGGRTMPTKNELSALFLERVFRLSRDGVKVSLLLPERYSEGNGQRPADASTRQHERRESHRLREQGNIHRY